ncbi:DNA-binding helix-turn-helix protein [Capnocytophaga sp. oral taxon 335 str. F0486]|jgi:HTH_3 family transcriptional regulator protein|uniref:helix-turn-helix domain-containing protein n=1 Tax=Capnocytophaga sp. oral taxon 335 TaxID=712215 RepID=UPI00026F396D|nr:helix-turn-helix transcriptional regulator [Capnocytophaga sp. oral taxon 335]EJF36545.1 DNA-binding helix-turn-helix protein [Capnocytophaga sp. oral taxon 335 str. F0486]
MLNTSDFAIRLQQVMDYYGLNAAAFADSLEIQRSGISHLLSERNKPSLDFILKLIEKFPEVDMYWITQGKGSFPRKEDKELTSTKKTQQPDLFSDIPEIEMQASTPAPPSVAIKEKQVEPKALPLLTNKHIKRIIFFYEDNRFEVFEN